MARQSPPKGWKSNRTSSVPRSAAIYLSPSISVFLTCSFFFHPENQRSPWSAIPAIGMWKRLISLRCVADRCSFFISGQELEMRPSKSYRIESFCSLKNNNETEWTTIKNLETGFNGSSWTMSSDSKNDSEDICYRFDFDHFAKDLRTDQIGFYDCHSWNRKPPRNPQKRAKKEKN